MQYSGGALFCCQAPVVKPRQVRMKATEPEAEAAPNLAKSPVRSPPHSPPKSPPYSQPLVVLPHSPRAREEVTNGFSPSPARSQTTPNQSSEMGRAFVYSPTALSSTNPFLADVQSAHSQIPSPSPVFNPLQHSSPASPAHGAFTRPQSAKTVTSSAHSQPISAPVVTASTAPPPPATRRHKVTSPPSTSPAANTSSVNTAVSAAGDTAAASSPSTSTNLDDDDDVTPPQPPPRKSLQLPVIGKPVASPDLAKGDTGIPVKTRPKKKNSRATAAADNTAPKTADDGEVVSTVLE